jgi:5'(3')-deoxyribonucleotidase
MSRLRIFVDCDGVLADFVGAVLDYLARNTPLTQVRREAIDQWDCFAAVGCSEHWAFFRDQCDKLNLCRSMAELPGARELWAECQRLGEARVLTTPMTVAWLSQRAAWLEAFGIPLGQQIQIGKDACKSLLVSKDFNLLIDDKAENCEAFQRAGGWAFCLAAPYNAHVSPEIPRGTHAEAIEWLRAVAGET